MADETEKAKKRPGRPRKKVVAAPVEIKGIVNAPTENNNLVEMVYQNPTILKKIFNILKGYNCDDTIIDFEPNSIRMTAKSFDGKTTIFPIFTCKLLNHYYCREPRRICVKRSRLSDLFKSIDKYPCKVTWLLKEEMQKSVLYVIIRNFSLNNEKQHEVELTEKFNAEVPVMPDDSKYPLKFTLPSKDFKQEITDIMQVSESFTIQKRSDDPLEFTYDVPKEVNTVNVWRDATTIALQTDIEPGDVVAATIMNAYIKAFSNANLGTHVRIAVDKYLPMSFTTELDKKKIDHPDGTTTDGYICTLKVFVEVNGARRPDV